MVSTRLGRTPVVRLAAFLAAIMFGSVLALGPTPARAEDPAGSADNGTQTLQSSASDFTGVGVDGKNYRLSELLKQGPVLLDFWTTWCKPCMQEIPKLQEVWQRHKAQGFTLLGIPSDDQKTAAKVKGLARSMGFVFPNVPDPTHRIGNAYNVRQFPTTVLIAKNGKIVKVTQGFNSGDDKAWEERIVALLAADGATGQEGK